MDHLQTTQPAKSSLSVISKRPNCHPRCGHSKLLVLRPAAAVLLLLLLLLLVVV
jgi:hypothetical protein